MQKRAYDPDALFDAIIVDKAQDFDKGMWIRLPDLLKDPDDSIFYVFFDDNQFLYDQIKNILINRNADKARSSSVVFWTRRSSLCLSYSEDFRKA